VNVAANAKRWMTLKEVRVQFKKNFKAIAADAEARNIIQKARIKGIDLAEYNVLFDTYGDDSDFGETALLLFYKKGLPKALREKVAGTYPKPADFEAYKERAMDLHLEWLNDREELKTWASSTTDRSTSSKTWASSTTDRSTSSKTANN
jgi:hypothetical protein